MSQGLFVHAAWIAYLVSLLAYSINTGFIRDEKAQRIVGGTGYTFLVLGFASHTVFQVMRMLDYWHQYQAFSIASASMFEALNFFAWWVALIYIITEPIAKTRLFSTFVVVIPLVAIAYSMFDQNIVRGLLSPRQLVPALKSPWLNIHVTTMFISYAAFMLSAAFAFYFLLRHKYGIGIKNIDAKFSLDEIDVLIYRFIIYGYPFLTFGIITGSIWADTAWGVYWSWDPKETWSLITWFVYTAFLHSRLSWGWKGSRTAIFALVGFLSVIITFLGVNYITKAFNIEDPHSYM